MNPLESLEDKFAQQAELREKLKGSMKLEEIVPDCFEQGGCKLGARATVQAPHKGKITITRGNGRKTEHDPMLFPLWLWPRGMQDDLMDMRDTWERNRVLKRLPK